jgi:hypothetical protein
LADQQALQILDRYYGHVGGATEFFEAMKPDDKKKIMCSDIILAATQKQWSV